MGKDVAAFLESLRTDSSMREKVDSALLAEALNSTELEDRLLEVAAGIARQNGFEVDPTGLRDGLELDLNLAEFTLLSEDGEEDGDLAAGGGSCHSRSGCRTPCRYCNIVDDLEPGIVDPVILEE